jgi:hypothetical protein
MVIAWHVELAFLVRIGQLADTFLIKVAIKLAALVMKGGLVDGHLAVRFRLKLRVILIDARVLREAVTTTGVCCSVATQGKAAVTMHVTVRIILRVAHCFLLIRIVFVRQMMVDSR